MTHAPASLRRRLQGASEWATRSIPPLLPVRLADAVRQPIKQAIRRLGLQPRRFALGVHHTWPGVVEATAGRIRGNTFSELLGPGEGRRMLDLGAGPCRFARRARDAGWDVTAVDARTVRLPEDLEGITFIESDVRAFDPAGFDTIAILGLLYHLPIEDQESLLARCAYTRVILETEVHTPGYVPRAAEPWGHEIVSRNGYAGVMFPEKDTPMASIGNTESFWATEPSLLKMFERCGFRAVDVVEPMHHSMFGTRRFYVLHAEPPTERRSERPR